MGDETWAAPALSAFLKVWVDHDLSMAQMLGRSLAVFVIRIDGYHELASRWGGEALERGLVSLTARLKKSLRSTDAIVRSAEDQFTVIHSFSGDQLTLHSIAKSMLKQLQQPLCFGASDQSLATSIGIAFYPEDGNGADLLLERAHEALKRTDRWGGNGFCVFSRSTAKKIAHDLSAHEGLRHALDGDNLSMRFQPIFDLATNRMTGVIGNGHWQQHEGHSLDMTAIDSIAKRAELLPRLNRWLVESVCRQSIDWYDRGIKRPIHLTMSRSQILDGQFVRLLSMHLKAKGMSPEMLEVSIDQANLLDQTDHRIHTALQQLTELGIALSLTNVGEGALALQSLRKLSIRSLSLAPGLVEVIGRCSPSETMISTLIGFAQSLGLGVRAVGVCSQDQLRFLRTHGCDEATGAFFTPALKGPDIDRLTNLKPFSAHQEQLEQTPQRLSMH